MIAQRLQEERFFPRLFVSHVPLNPYSSRSPETAYLLFPNGQLVPQEELVEKLRQACSPEDQRHMNPHSIGTGQSYLSLVWTVRPDESFPHHEEFVLRFVSEPESQAISEIDFDDSEVDFEDFPSVETTVRVRPAVRGRAYILGACFWKCKSRSRYYWGDEQWVELPGCLEVDGIYASPKFRETVLSVLPFSILTRAYCPFVEATEIPNLEHRVGRWKRIFERIAPELLEAESASRASRKARSGLDSLTLKSFMDNLFDFIYYCFPVCYLGLFSRVITNSLSMLYGPGGEKGIRLSESIRESITDEEKETVEKLSESSSFARILRRHLRDRFGENTDLLLPYIFIFRNRFLSVSDLYLATTVCPIRVSRDTSEPTHLRVPSFSLFDEAYVSAPLGLLFSLKGRDIQSAFRRTEQLIRQLGETEETSEQSRETSIPWLNMTSS